MANEYIDQVAAGIIKQLQEGTAPWQKPWEAGERFMPYNPTSGNAYRGMNAVWLMSQAEGRGFDDSRWMTYKQAAGQDAQVRKSEKGTAIQFWKWEGLEPVRDKTGKPVLDGQGEPQKQRVRYEKPRVWTAVVFNAQQIDGLPAPADRPALPEWERHERAEAILSGSQVGIQHKPGDRAFYRPSTDTITLPDREQFSSGDRYYATALHELGHATGHESRLGRDLSHPFGSEGYAREELRAEIASLMLGEQLGIGHDPGQHAAYVQSWIKALQNDPREIFRAAADAEKITKLVQSFEIEREQERAPTLVRMAGLITPEAGVVRQVAKLGLTIDGALAEVATAEAPAQALDEAVPITAPTLKEYLTNTLKAGLKKTGRLTAALDQEGPLTDPLRLSLWDRVVERVEKAWDGFTHVMAMHTPADQAPDRWTSLNRDLERAARPRLRDRLEDLADRFGRAIGYIHERTDLDQPAPILQLEQAAPEPMQAALPAPQASLPTYIRGEHPAVSPADDRRVYLAVPYAEKDDAKQAGAKWDKAEKAWFVPAGVELDAFTAWMPAKDSVHIAAGPDPREEFASALQNAGLKLDGPPMMDGQLHRVQVEDDKAKERSGAYKGYLDGRPAGFIQNHKTGEKTNWKASSTPTQLSIQDRAQMAAEAAQKRQDRAGERERMYERTAQQVDAIWAAATPTAAHPYLASKEVEAHGLRQDRSGNLLVPVQDVDGKLWSLQRISADGSKQFKEHGRIDGGHYVIGDVDQPGPLLIAEGFATAATVSELSGQPTIVAFNAGNLLKVAAAYREEYPDRLIYIASDNDHLKEAAGKPNVGREKAEVAAQAIGGQVLLPSFAESAQGSDWNDLAKLSGRDAAGKQLKVALLGAERDQIAAGMAAARSVDRSASLAPVQTPKKEREREAAEHER